MHFERQGLGSPLLLVHGLGSSLRNWDPVVAALALDRDVIAVDLPGFGETAPLNGEVTIATLTDAVEQFLTSEGLDNIDIVGSSMGARMVLEMARRGHAGTTVSLDPGGFWSATGRRPSSVPACGPPLRSSVESSPRFRFSPDTRVGALCCSRSSPPSLGDSTATALFPDPTLHWFKACGHFPHWDQPAQAVQLILDSTS